MKNLFFCLLMFHTPNSTANINKELVPYYHDFIRFIPKSCKFIGVSDISFAVLKNSVLGECTVSLHKSKIEINEIYWEVLNENQKKQLMYHELSHCILDVDHSVDKTNYMTSEGFPKLSDIELENQVISNIIEYCSEN